jgi:hypothetical protein
MSQSLPNLVLNSCRSVVASVTEAAARTALLVVWFRGENIRRISHTDLAVALSFFPWRFIGLPPASLPIEGGFPFYWGWDPEREHTAPNGKWKLLDTYMFDRRRLGACS